MQISASRIQTRRFCAAGNCFSFSMQINSFSRKLCKKKASQLLLEGFPRLRYYTYGLMVPDIPTNK